MLAYQKMISYHANTPAHIHFHMYLVLKEAVKYGGDSRDIIHNHLNLHFQDQNIWLIKT